MYQKVNAPKPITKQRFQKENTNLDYPSLLAKCREVKVNLIKKECKSNETNLREW